MIRTENDFLGFLTLGSLVRKVSRAAKSAAEMLNPMLDRMAVRLFTAGWQAKESGKWKSVEEALDAARRLGRTIKRVR